MTLSMIAAVTGIRAKGCLYLSGSANGNKYGSVAAAKGIATVRAMADHCCSLFERITDQEAGKPKL